MQREDRHSFFIPLGHFSAATNFIVPKPRNLKSINEQLNRSFMLFTMVFFWPPRRLKKNHFLLILKTFYSIITKNQMRKKIH